MTAAPIYVVDEMASIVSAVDAVLFPSLGKHINYMFGHPLEIINTLQQLTNSLDPVQRASKYPLVALFQDFKEKRGEDVGLYATVSLNMIIANITDNTSNAATRYQNNFKPILYSVYSELIRQIPIHKYTLSNGRQRAAIEVKNDDEIKHTKIDRVYWGKTGLFENKANVFNDFLDCIEIQNLELTFLNKDF